MTQQMKIGYGTYGMPEVPVWDALPRIAAIGYEAVEICAAERWPTAPHKLSPADRQRLRDLVRELGLDLPAVMVFVNPLAPEGEELDRHERLFRDTCILARDLQVGARPPVISSPLGHGDAPWDEIYPLILERAARFGAIAEEEGCRFALEPHSGGLLDRPDRVVFLMERVQSPSLGINFDISHFSVGEFDRAETIRALTRFALHTHVKDGRMEEGKIRFYLPGELGFDYAAYFHEMAEAGWSGPVVCEVSAQIFNRPGYDPWPAAQYCFDVLSRARGAAFPGAASESHGNR